MEKHIVRLKDEQTDVTSGNQWVLQFSGTTLRADRLCELNQLAVIPAENTPVLYTVENQRIKSGDRVAIIGANGTGKSSLLKMIWSLSLASYSLLMLDEPTNHIDMEGKKALAEQINQFPGGVLLVSHDRELIENSCNRFWYIHNGILTEHHDIEVIYQLISEEEMSEAPRVDKLNNLQNTSSAPLVSHHDDDEKLFKLIELEEKLEADLARKTNHQKPALQAQWKLEINQLKQALKLI